MKKFMMFFILLLGSMALTSCDSYGTEKEFYGVQLFYTSAVNEAEADKLGKYLVDSKFADGDKKTVQLNKNGNTYEFRMVVKKGLEQDAEYIELAKQFGSDLSKEVFNGSQVDMHFCDEYLKTLKVVPMARD